MHTVNEFGDLICGNVTQDMLDLGEAIQNLNNKITRITQLILDYDWEQEKVDIDIPVYGRNILESVFTAILGRVDPFRIIIVYKVQSDSSYDLGKRAQVAVEWSGDIIAKSAANNMWNFEKKKEAFDRALLGNYMGEIVWKQAFIALNDYMEQRTYESQWLDEILALGEHENFEKIKSLASTLFSSFSKGVHSECLIDVEVILDIVTLKSLVKDLYKLCATVGLVSHFVGFLATKIEKERALDIFFKVEEMIENV